MGIIVLSCEKCGAKLEKDDSGYFCPHCGNRYEIEQDVNVTNYNNIDKSTTINNYYGEATKKKIDNDKISAYFNQFVLCINNKDYSGANTYLNRILYADPNNVDAMCLAIFLNAQKKNGRFKNGVGVSLPKYNQIDSMFDIIKQVNEANKLSITFNLLNQLFDNSENVYEHELIYNLEINLPEEKVYEWIKALNSIESTEKSESLKRNFLNLIDFYKDKEEKEKAHHQEQEQKAKKKKKEKIILIVIIAILTLGVFLGIGFCAKVLSDGSKIVEKKYYATYYSSNYSNAITVNKGENYIELGDGVAKIHIKATIKYNYYGTTKTMDIDDIKTYRYKGDKTGTMKFESSEIELEDSLNDYRIEYHYKTGIGDAYIDFRYDVQTK